MINYLDDIPGRRPGRRRVIDYAGATGRCPIGLVPSLGPSYALQPKIDGSWVRLTLDSRGKVANVYTRKCLLTGPLARELVGAHIGAPHAELVGEFEAWTESANRAASTRGYRLVHLHDCIRDGQRYLAGEPYRVRRDALHRMQAALQGPLPWTKDADGNAHSRRTGRFCAEVPRDWRIAPIVPQMATSKFDEAWAEWVARPGGEGLVAVNLDAPMDKRRAKLKIKAVDTLDAVVLSVDKRRFYCSWGGQVFAVGRGKHIARPGECLEIAHNGFFEKVTIPKFPRVVRIRQDLPRAINFIHGPAVRQ